MLRSPLFSWSKGAAINSQPSGWASLAGFRSHKSDLRPILCLRQFSVPPPAYIVGIETSCDDTAVSVISTHGEIVSEIRLSQNNIHNAFGGIIPRIAVREHSKSIDAAVNYALRAADIFPTTLPDLYRPDGSLNEIPSSCSNSTNKSMTSTPSSHTKKTISAVAVASGPGLAPCLRVGILKAKQIAKALSVPVIPVNHIEAHAAVALLNQPQACYPFLTLTVSGGHSHIAWVKGPGDAVVLGETVDDAVGESLDKTYRMLRMDEVDLAVVEQIIEDEETWRDKHAKHPLSLDDDLVVLKMTPHNKKALSIGAADMIIDNNDIHQCPTTNDDLRYFKVPRRDLELMNVLSRAYICLSRGSSERTCGNHASPSSPQTLRMGTPNRQWDTDLTDDPFQIASLSCHSPGPTPPLLTQHVPSESITPANSTTTNQQGPGPQRNPETNSKGTTVDVVPGAVVERASGLFERILALLEKSRCYQFVPESLNSQDPLTSSASTDKRALCDGVVGVWQHVCLFDRGNPLVHLAGTSATTLAPATCHPLLPSLQLALPMREPSMHGYCDMSFSGLKTAVLTQIEHERMTFASLQTTSKRLTTSRTSLTKNGEGSTSHTVSSTGEETDWPSSVIFRLALCHSMQRSAFALIAERMNRAIAHVLVQGWLPPSYPTLIPSPLYDHSAPYHRHSHQQDNPSIHRTPSTQYYAPQWRNGKMRPSRPSSEIDPVESDTEGLPRHWVSAEDIIKLSDKLDRILDKKGLHAEISHSVSFDEAVEEVIHLLNRPLSSSSPPIDANQLVSQVSLQTDVLPQWRPTVVLCGGVASSSTLRSLLRHVLYRAGFSLLVAPPHLCTDNGTMIAWMGALLYMRATKTNTLLTTEDLNIDGDTTTGVAVGKSTNEATQKGPLLYESNYASLEARPRWPVGECVTVIRPLSTRQLNKHLQHRLAQVPEHNNSPHCPDPTTGLKTVTRPSTPMKTNLPPCDMQDDFRLVPGEVFPLQGPSQQSPHVNTSSELPIPPSPTISSQIKTWRSRQRPDKLIRLIGGWSEIQHKVKVMESNGGKAGREKQGRKMRFTDEEWNYGKSVLYAMLEGTTWAKSMHRSLDTPKVNIGEG